MLKARTGMTDDEVVTHLTEQNPGFTQEKAAMFADGIPRSKTSGLVKSNPGPNGQLHVTAVTVDHTTVKGSDRRFSNWKVAPPLNLATETSDSSFAGSLR